LSKHEGMSQREIAARLGISKTTVNEILKREGREAAYRGPGR
jgi:DNA-binding transcriptional regulator LsrR (DeoR family)